MRPPGHCWICHSTGNTRTIKIRNFMKFHEISRKSFGTALWGYGCATHKYLERAPLHWHSWNLKILQCFKKHLDSLSAVSRPLFAKKSSFKNIFWDQQHSTPQKIFAHFCDALIPSMQPHFAFTKKRLLTICEFRNFMSNSSSSAPDLMNIIPRNWNFAVRRGSVLRFKNWIAQTVHCWQFCNKW